MCIASTNDKETQEPTTSKEINQSKEVVATHGSGKTDHQWHMFGTTFDLEAFCAQHPGGALAIRLGQGEKDCTKLFENYHMPSKRHVAVLEKFRTGPAMTLPAESKFRNDLEEMLVDHFDLKSGTGSKARDAYKATNLHLAFACAILVAQCALYYGWWRGSVASMLLLPFVQWLVTCNVAHDCSHFTFTKYQFINQIFAHSASPLFFNAITWYHQHVVSHHTSTNEIDNDCDLQHFAPMKLSPHDNLPKVGKHSWVDFLKLAGVGAHLSLVCPMFAEGLFPGQEDYFKMFKPAIVVPGGLGRLYFYRLQNLVGPIQFFVFMLAPLFLRDTLAEAAMFVLVPLVLASLIFLAVTQSSHIQPECQDPMEDETDFWKRQARTSVDYSADSGFWTLMTGGLNVQAIHHCLPMVSCSHYKALYPKFEAVCAKNGIIIHKRRHIGHAMWTGMQHVWSLNNSARLLLFSEGHHH